MRKSFFSRFALNASSILSFGLYAALAGAALLVVWTLRGPDAENVATAEAAPAVSTPAAPTSSEPVLSPVLPAVTNTTPEQTGQPRQAGDRPAVAAGGAGAASAAAAATGGGAAAAAANTQPAIPTLTADNGGAGGDEFGDVVMSDNPLMPPRLAEAPGLPFDEAAVSEPPQTQPVGSTPATTETAPVAPLTPTVGPTMPFTMTPQMAALRTAAATGPTIVAMPQSGSSATTPTPAGDSGL